MVSLINSVKNGLGALGRTGRDDLDPVPRTPKLQMSTRWAEAHEKNRRELGDALPHMLGREEGTIFDAVRSHILQELHQDGPKTRMASTAPSAAGRSLRIARSRLMHRPRAILTLWPPQHADDVRPGNAASHLANLATRSAADRHARRPAALGLGRRRPRRLLKARLRMVQYARLVEDDTALPAGGTKARQMS